jgi:hypothetical protein
MAFSFGFYTNAKQTLLSAVKVDPISPCKFGTWASPRDTHYTNKHSLADSLGEPNRHWHRHAPLVLRHLTTPTCITGTAIVTPRPVRLFV